MGKIKNLSLRKTIVLYMIISLIISFYLSALIMRIASTVQNNIWWNYVDQEEYFEMEEQVTATVAGYLDDHLKGMVESICQMFRDHILMK